MKKTVIVALVIALTAALACTACAETIRPRPVTTDINRLENRMVRTDIEYKGDGHMLLTLYEQEFFTAEAIRAVKVGDVIVTDGKEVTIESIEMDGPDYIYNKDTGTEMLFCDAGNDEFQHSMENEEVPWIELGTIEMGILQYYPILDIVDPLTGQELEEYIIYRGDKLEELLQNPDAVPFNARNVDVVYGGANQPILMMRWYNEALDKTNK